MANKTINNLSLVLFVMSKIFCHTLLYSLSSNVILLVVLVNTAGIYWFLFCLFSHLNKDLNIWLLDIHVYCGM